MNRITQYILCSSFLLYSAIGQSQDINTVELHIQFYDQGICMPMVESDYYSTSRYQTTKSVLKSAVYYSTIYAYINSPDSADLNPQTNHILQSSSLQFNPTLDYELVFLRYDGFNKSAPDSMIINITKLDKDAQLIIPFKKGNFQLEKMKFFEKLKTNAAPVFQSNEIKSFKKRLKLDSTTYFPNGKTKTNYYIVSTNFLLYYAQEFDSINPSIYSQGLHLLNHNGNNSSINQLVLTNGGSPKYGYWEYFENGKRVKHEIWASVIQQKFEWYPSGRLKSETHFSSSNKEAKHIFYLENGDIKEEFHTNSTTRTSAIKSYAYSPQGKIILINTYKSLNGITKQKLQKRELFYPSGKLKMEENFIGTYNIKYYNEDGTEKIN